MLLRLCSTVPPAQVLSGTPTVTATTITITGSVPSGSVVTGFVVEWQRDTSVGCSDEDEDRVSVNGAFTSYITTGLEPGNRYTITVTVSNSAGSSGVSNTVTAMTEETGREAQMFKTQTLRFISSTAPSGSPTGIIEVAVTPNTITVQWGEVSCLHHNGEITGYIVEAITSGEVVGIVNINDGDARRVTVTGLNSSTQYTVQVAAVNNAGTGPSTGIAVQTEGECSVYRCCCL